MVKIKKVIFRLMIFFACAALIAGLASFIINQHIKNQTKADIIYTASDYNGISSQDAEKLKAFGADCIIVLGAGIKDSETPTPMLQDRLDLGIDLYKNGVAPKLLLSGDNGQISHNELHVMLSYSKEAGVPEEDIFCDHAGFSTYDSMYRAGSIFGAEKAIVVTQKYHEYRALYIGKKLGLDVVGASADQQSYVGQFMRDLREYMARNKDFFKVISKPDPLLGGESIPISGSGIISHGE